MGKSGRPECVGQNLTWPLPCKGKSKAGWPSHFRDWSLPISQLSQKRNWDFRSSAYQPMTMKTHTRSKPLSQNSQEIVVCFSCFLWRIPWSHLTHHLDHWTKPLAEMLQFDRLGFLFQSANLKVHSDGTNVTLLETPPGNGGFQKSVGKRGGKTGGPKMASKVWGYKRGQGSWGKILLENLVVHVDIYGNDFFVNIHGSKIPYTK